MRILGIDPGYGITGFGLIEAERGQSRLLQCGAITTPAGMDFSARLEIIYEDMRKLLEVAKPDAVAIEELFFGQNVTTGIGVAQSRGVILLAVRQAGLEVTSYKPMQVKQAVVGYGNATKHQVMDMTKRILKLSQSPKPDDAADALALYVNDRADGDGVIVGKSAYIQQMSKLNGFASDEMKNEVHRTGRLGSYDGCEMSPISSAKKLGDGSAIFPDKRVYGIAVQIGSLSMKGETSVYETMDNNNESVHLKFADFTFGVAFNKDTLEKVVKAELA